MTAWPGHEDVHADDAFNLYATSRSMAAFLKEFYSNDFQYQTEYDAHWVDAGVSQVLSPPGTTVTYGLYTRPTPPGMAPNLPERLDIKYDTLVIEEHVLHIYPGYL